MAQKTFSCGKQRVIQRRYDNPILPSRGVWKISGIMAQYLVHFARSSAKSSSICLPHHPLPLVLHTRSANPPLIFFFYFLLLLTRSFVCCVLNVWQTMASNQRCWSSIVVKYYRFVPAFDVFQPVKHLSFPNGNPVSVTFPSAWFS